MQSRTSQSNRGMALLSAIVAGDAAIEDIAAELTREGITSVEGTLRLLREDTMAHEAKQADNVRRVDVQRFQRLSSVDASQIVQRIPEVPFLLNGTLYDPGDITRFNGVELHFVVAPTGDHMLAIDDRDVMGRWWQLLYFEKYRSVVSQARVSALGYAGIGPAPEAAGDRATIREYNLTYFCEHIDSRGDFIILWGDRGYYDLTQVCKGPFCTGDWNDEISSIGMDETRVAVLWEHIHWTGQSLTATNPTPPSGIPNLHVFGWGDRASSLETW